MEAPKSLEEAKAAFGREKAKVTGSLSAIAGSRWLMAILATFAMAFASHTLYARERLPNVEGLRFEQTGLPPSVDFGFAGEQAGEIRDAAVREGAKERAAQALAENAERIPLFNMIGLGLSLALLLANMWIMTKRRRVTRG